jgi:hypothetical protein
MSTKNKIERDTLVDYLNPATRIKAPEGFTDGILNIIETENITTFNLKLFISRNRVPIISGIITIILIILSVLFNGTAPVSKYSQVISFFQELNNKLPEINFDSVINFSLPSWLIYILMGLSILALIDLGLNTFFKKIKKKIKESPI